MTPHKALDAALLSCWTIHAGGKYDKEAFKTLQRFVDALPVEIERKIAEAVAAEREACAKLCDEMSDWPFEKHTSTTIKSHDYQIGIVRGLVNATNAIRARSKP